MIEPHIDLRNDDDNVVCSCGQILVHNNNRCEQCNTLYPKELGGPLCPRCEDYQLEAMDAKADLRGKYGE